MIFQNKFENFIAFIFIPNTPAIIFFFLIDHMDLYRQYLSA